MHERRRGSVPTHLPPTYTSAVRNFVVVALAIVLAGCASVPDSQPAAPAPDSEQFQIESTVLAVYNVISGPAGRRDWDRFKDLFAPGAQLISTRVTDGVVSTRVMTTDDYIAATTENFAKNGFFERPLGNRVTIYRDIANVISAYESRHASADEKPFIRGINSFQLVKLDGRWKVQQILWEPEDAAHPIPAELARAR